MFRSEAKTVDEKSFISEKWGTVVSGGATGFQVLPDVLVRSQSRLGLSSGELVVLINILMHWWKKDELPYPRPEAIARRMGVSKRTIERYLESLEKKGLFERLAPEVSATELTKRRFKLDGLVAKLTELAQDLRHNE